MMALPVINNPGLFHAFFDSLSQQIFHEHLLSVRHSKQKEPSISGCFYTCERRKILNK